MIAQNTLRQLTLHNFTLTQLREWRSESKRRYPDFELVLLVRQSPQWAGELEYTCHFRPLPGAPQVLETCDFPWKPFWDSLTFFYHEGADYSTEIELIWQCYPSQSSFVIPNTQMESWQLQLGDDEKDDLTVAELLNSYFAVPKGATKGAILTCYQ